MKGSGNGEGAALRVCACRAGVPPGTGREPGTQPGGDRDAVRSQRSAGRVRLGPDPWEMGSGSGAPRTPTPFSGGCPRSGPGLGSAGGCARTPSPARPGPGSRQEGRPRPSPFSRPRVSPGAPRGVVGTSPRGRRPLLGWERTGRARRVPALVRGSEGKVGCSRYREPPLTCRPQVAVAQRTFLPLPALCRSGRRCELPWTWSAVLALFKDHANSSVPVPYEALPASLGRKESLYHMHLLLNTVYFPSSLLNAITDPFSFPSYGVAPREVKMHIFCQRWVGILCYSSCIYCKLHPVFKNQVFLILGILTKYMVLLAL